MKYNVLRATTALLNTIFLAGCSVFGAHDVNEPSFSIIRSDGDFEVREYQPMVVASTVVTGNFKEAGKQGFRPLFQYITGANASAAEIPMTAPVISANLENTGQQIPMTAPVLAQKMDTQAIGNTWEYQFVLPQSMTFDNAPIPTNEAVIIKKVEGKKVAVLTFSGLLSDSNRVENTNKLKSWLESQKLVQKKSPMIAGYDPPWTVPFMRRNEIIIEIE